jgi:hypothetical protein
VLSQIERRCGELAGSESCVAWRFELAEFAAAKATSSGVTLDEPFKFVEQTRGLRRNSRIGVRH